MAAISKARHYKLTDDLQKTASILFLNGKTVTDLNDEAIKLETLYEKYRLKLIELQTLIKEYDIMQRRVKIKLRQQQIKNLKRELLSGNKAAI